jgi:DNA polymerase III gamma/tau subunit
MADSMPNLGSAPAVSTPTASHTATEPWQSFEIRMRHRRAARCVLRAEVALEAGFEQDARAALDEARRLSSQTPDFETLRAIVAERLAADLALRRTMKRRRASGIAAAALVFLTIGAGAFWATGEPPRAVTAAAEARPETAAATAPATDTPVRRRPEAPATGLSASATPTAREIKPEVKAAPEKRLPLAEAPTVRPAPETREAKAVEPATVRVSPAPALPEPRTVAVSAPSTTGSIERVAAGLPATAPPRATSDDAALEDASRLEEPSVRATLARYESAYSSLNPSAAQAVWPGVNERSLTRAFESLESQRVSLGRCSVRIDGGAARADCSGSVTWTPKVGGGPQSQPRQWQFELSHANGAWVITRAEAR